MKVLRSFILTGAWVILLWGGYTIDYSPAEFSFYKEKGYDRIKTPRFELCGEPGTPELPAVYLNYIIPPNARAESIIISQFHLVQIPGKYLIFPAQPPSPIGETLPWVPPDTLIYNSDSLFPGRFIRITDVGIMDGARIVTVEFRPLRYRPKTGRLYIVRQVQFEFVFGPNSLPELRPQVRGRYEQMVYDVAIREVVENDYEVSAYYQKPVIVEENQLGSISPFPTAPAVIIAPDEFHSAFQVYADWMTDQGIRTALISPQTIYGYFNGRDDAEKIRNYIKYCYEHSGGTYFILGGDDYSTGGIEFVSVRYCYLPKEGIVDSNASIPCDLYFSDLTGDWDKNNNGKWGEIDDDAADRYPEVYVGRLTPYCVQEVNNWINKVFGYEKNPNLVHTTALWLYKGMNIGDAYTVFPDYFTHDSIEMNNAQEAVENYLSYGYGIDNIHCHGKRKYFCDWQATIRVWSYWPYTPSQFNDGLNNLANFDKYYFVYSLACHNGGYDSHLIDDDDPQTPPIYPTDTCIADAFTDTYSDDIGACAFLGYTRASILSGVYDLEYEFYHKLFTVEELPPVEPSVTRLGVSEALSKCGKRIDWMDKFDRHNCYAHNLFGSPYTEAWTNQPGNMSVSHPTRIYVGITTKFTVTVKDEANGNPLQYAKVCLNKPGDIYEVGSTDARGKVTFIIRPGSVGFLKVTVTRFHNSGNNYLQYRPSETYCQVLIAPGGNQSVGSEEVLPTQLTIKGLSTIVNQKVVISYGTPEQGDISFSIYDVAGARLRWGSESNISPGYHNKTINITDMANGVYFIVLEQNNKQIMRKFLLVR